MWGQSEGASVDTDDVERTSEGASDGGREGSKHLFGRSFRHRTCFPPWNTNRLKWFFFESVLYVITASCLTSSSSEGAALFTADLNDLAAKLPNMASPVDRAFDVFLHASATRFSKRIGIKIAASRFMLDTLLKKASWTFRPFPWVSKTISPTPFKGPSNNARRMGSSM